MGSSFLDAETLDRDASASAQSERPLTLTIAHHPDPARVGHRVRLPLLEHPRARLRIGRAEPLFRAGPDDAGRPLETPFVSRKPLHLDGLGGGAVRVDASACGSRVEVDGAPLTATLDLDPDAIERGVVLQAGSHVVLVLHRAAGEAPLGASAIVGASDGVVRVREAIARIGPDSGNVLVRGETGSGKELVAAALHEASARRGGPFVAVNMAAVTPTLAASQLFGHVRGAFSGADQNHDGLFVRAHGGTLFLDEVGDTPSDVQAALLRVLETGEVMPVGGRAARKVDVRIVAATDADLEDGISDGRFRAPLFYRLATNEVRIPPLRDRKPDIGSLLVHFLRGELAALGRAALLHPAATDASPWLSAALVARLARYDWPGNVRQLKSLAHALALASPAPLADDEIERLLAPRRAPPAVKPPAPAQPSEPAPTSPKVRGRTPASITPDEVERMLAECDYRLSVAADRFGISRPSMNDLVDRHPRLKRAQSLTVAEIEGARVAAARRGEALWRVLAVSERGLKQRMTELGLE